MSATALKSLSSLLPLFVMSACPSKAATGSEQSPFIVSSPIYRRESPTSEDSWKPEPRRRLFTGKSSCVPASSAGSDGSKRSLDPVLTGSLPEAGQQPITSGNSTPVSKEPSSNSASNQSIGIERQTGIESRRLPSLTSSTGYPVIYWFAATTNCVLCATIISNHLRSFGAQWCIGVSLGQVNRTVPGQKPESTVTAKVGDRLSRST